MALLTDLYQVFLRPGVRFLSGFFGPAERLLADPAAFAAAAKRMPRPPTLALREFVPGNAIYANSGNGIVYNGTIRDIEGLAEDPVGFLRVVFVQLRSLTAKSLLTHDTVAGESRIGMLETIREFATERRRSS